MKVVCTLSHSVLLGSVACGVSPVNATIVCEFDKGIGHEFSTLVILKFYDFGLELVLSKCLVGFESFKGITFVLEA